MYKGAEKLHLQVISDASIVRRVLELALSPKVATFVIVMAARDTVSIVLIVLGIGWHRSFRITLRIARVRPAVRFVVAVERGSVELSFVPINFVHCLDRFFAIRIGR